ncbi:MAG: putative Ig domain-containing protein [Candidatus Aminicenantes bacterium]|nr:putative Ig domain-containing protein [Candidatus Aminicenantes bacterium]
MKKLKVKKIVVYLIPLFLVSILASCGGGRTPAPVKKKQQVEEITVDTGEVSTPVRTAVKKSDRIKRTLLFPPDMRAGSRIRAAADLSPALNPDEDEALSYIFYKNTKLFKEQEENSVPPNSYKKGDSLFVDALFYKEGEEIERKRSDMVFITNSKPEIGEVEFPTIKGMGTYTIVVNASDEDKDKLTFSLDKDYGIPPGMTINAGSGTITYTLDSDPGTKVKFKVVVRDGDGGEDWNELAINFARQRTEKK